MEEEKTINFMKKQRKVKQSSWDKFSKFAADFETTAHKEFSDEEILANDRNTFAVNENVVDFTPNESSQVFLAGLMSLKDYTYKLSFENIATFINNVADMTYQEHHTRAIVYFHNLAYDGEYLLKWLIKNGYKQTLQVDEITHQPLILRKQFSLLKTGGKFFSLVIYWRGIKIHFLDSMKLFPQSLASLGESIGYKKLKELVDYSKFEINKDHKYPENWLFYLQRDCEILARYLNQFFANEDKSHTLKRQTIGSVSYAYIKQTIDEFIPYKKEHGVYKYGFTIADYMKFEPYYAGGLTFPSFKYWGKWVYKPNRIKMIDACSMYPSQMVKPLPYGQPLSEPPQDSPYCTYYKIRIKKATIKEKYNDIAILRKPFEMQDGKKVFHFTNIKTIYQYIQEVKNEIYYFVDKELELMQKLYDMEFEILEETYFKLAPYLENSVRQLFQAKKDAKAKGDAVNTMLAKLRINNLYGKTGQKPIRNQDYYGSLDDLDLTKYKVVGEKNTLDEGYNIQKIKEHTDKAQPIFLAAYITALARCSLLDKYLYITSKGGKFLYCDTDSICFIDSPKGIKFNDIGNDLGLWEYEDFKQFKLDKNYNYVLDEEGKPILLEKKNVADGFCSLCPKQYRIADKEYPLPVKLASAGVKKDIIIKVAHQDYNYDLGENKKYHIRKTTLKESVNGKVIWESPFNFIKWKKIKTNPICPKELFRND